MKLVPVFFFRPAAVLLAVCAVLSVASCDRDRASAADTGKSPSPAAAPPAASPPAVALADIAESDPRYVVGISFPPGIGRYPGLASELKRYADAARTELMTAVAGLDGPPETGPFDLTLTFTELLSTPHLVTVGAEGSTYTGGAHGLPLIARFNWLTREQRLLTAAELIPQPQGWAAVAPVIRAGLRAALEQRLADDDVPVADRKLLAEQAGKTIEEGTRPMPANFAHFEPVVDRSGVITALRFVFPPYQVAAYADGTQKVEVPAHVLRPHVAPAYRGLFSTAPPPAPVEVTPVDAVPSG